ncbi:MAG: hypothetical protein M3O25_01725, partial [Actinomycetota bacterium]|nr:hypothetical protein [Actinomycetota bacterium]
MRTKLTALICALGAAAALAAAALAAPIPVAYYAFSTQGDVDAFTKGLGAKCAKKWSQNKQLAITVGPGTAGCQFRSSVVGDSTDPGSDTEVTATGVLAANTPRKLQKRGYIGIGTRVSETAGWELRVRPVARSWQLFRDAKGPATGPELFRSGKGKFIRSIGKPNLVLLRSFDYGGTATQLLVLINGNTILT